MLQGKETGMEQNLNNKKRSFYGSREGTVNNFCYMKSNDLLHMASKKLEAVEASNCKYYFCHRTDTKRD